MILISQKNAIESEGFKSTGFKQISRLEPDFLGNRISIQHRLRVHGEHFTMFYFNFISVLKTVNQNYISFWNWTMEHWNW